MWCGLIRPRGLAQQNAERVGQFRNAERFGQQRAHCRRHLLLENKPTTPIIFLTGGREDEWSLVATVSVTLEKPAPAARLVEVVRNLLDEPTSQRLHRNSSQRLAVRSSRPYVWTAPVPAAYCGCGIND